MILTAQKYKIFYKNPQNTAGLFFLFACISSLLKKLSLSLQQQLLRSTLWKTNYAHEKFPKLCHCLLLGQHLNTCYSMWPDCWNWGPSWLRASLSCQQPLPEAPRQSAMAIAARAKPLPRGAVLLFVEMLALVPCQGMYYLQFRLSLTTGWTWKAWGCGSLVPLGHFLLANLTNSLQVPLKETSQSVMKNALKIC